MCVNTSENNHKWKSNMATIRSSATHWFIDTDSTFYTNWNLLNSCQWIWYDFFHWSWFLLLIDVVLIGDATLWLFWNHSAFDYSRSYYFKLFIFQTITLWLFLLSNEILFSNRLNIYQRKFYFRFIRCVRRKKTSPYTYKYDALILDWALDISHVPIRYYVLNFYYLILSHYTNTWNPNGTITLSK